MTHAVQNFDMQAGDDKAIDVTVTSDGMATGTPVDITGATITWTLRRSVENTVALVTKATPGGIQITDGPNGRFTINLADADTAGLLGLYLHEAVLADVSSNDSTVLNGVATFTPKAGTAALVTGTYMTVAESDCYWSDRNDAAWAQADPLDKVKALLEATQYLDGQYDWIGSIASESQTLGWPRFGAIDHEGRRLTDIPRKVKDACAELAQEALAGRLLPAAERGGMTKREKVGPLEVAYQDGAAARKTYPFVDRLLRGLVRGGFGKRRLART